MIHIIIIFELVYTFLQDVMVATPSSGSAIPQSSVQLTTPQSDILDPSLSVSTHRPNTTKYAAYLKALYSSCVSPPSQQGLPLSGNKYVDLTIVRKGDFSMEEMVELASERAAGNFGLSLSKSQAVSMEDIVRYEGDSKCVLVEGPLGVGKTSLAWELCRRWDELESLKRFSLILFVQHSSLSCVEEANCFADLVYHRNSSLQQAVVEEIESSEGEGLLLVIDEFCEFPKSKLSMFARLFDGSYLPNAKLLVLSRPLFVSDLLAACTIEQSSQFEILGFTEESVVSFAKIALKDKPALEGFLTYLVGNVTLRGLLSVPLLCAVVVNILLGFSCIVPKPSTEILSTVFKALILRHMLKEGKVPSSYKMPPSLQDLPDFSQIAELAKLAFDGTLQKKYTFDNLTLVDFFSGFLSQMLNGQAHFVSYFLHRLLQEYLTALHMTTLPANEQQQLFREHGQASNFENVWRFVSGLSQFRHIGWELVKLHYGQLPYTGSDEDFVEDDEDQSGSMVYYTDSFLFHILYEAQNQSACETVFQEGGQITYQPQLNQPSPFDMFAIGYCLAHSKCEWFLDFRLNTVGQKAVESLCTCLNSQPMVNGIITSIIGTRESAFRGPGLYELAKMPKSILEGIASLDLPECEVDTQALYAVLPKLSNLMSLDAWCYVGAGKAVPILQQLLKLHRLDSLLLNCSQYNPADMDALSSLVNSSSSLSELEVKGTDLTPACTELLLSSTIAQSASLRTLRLLEINLECCSELFQHLLSSTNLGGLVIAECTLETKTAVCIAQALTNNTSLQLLQISSSSVAEEGAVALSKMLAANSALKTFVLCDFSLGPTGACAITEALQRNSTIRQVVLPKAYKSHVSAEVLENVAAELTWFP